MPAMPTHWILHSPYRMLAGENIGTLSAFPGFEYRTAQGVRKSVVPRGRLPQGGPFQGLDGPSCGPAVKVRPSGADSAFLIKSSRPCSCSSTGRWDQVVVIRVRSRSLNSTSCGSRLNSSASTSTPCCRRVSAR